MKTTIQGPHYEHALGRLPVNTHDGKYSCYKQILDNIANQLQAMLYHHSRVTVIRFDLHLYRPFETNKEMSRLIDKIKKRLRAKYGLTRLGYVWVREVERAKSHHYHVALFVNGNKLQYPSNLLNWIEKVWTARGHPKPFVPKHCFYVVPRGDSWVRQVAFKRLSYLAKVRGKGCKYRARRVNDYATSRLGL